MDYDIRPVVTQVSHLEPPASSNIRSKINSMIINMSKSSSTYSEEAQNQDEIENNEFHDPQQSNRMTKE